MKRNEKKRREIVRNIKKRKYKIGKEKWQL